MPICMPICPICPICPIWPIWPIWPIICGAWYMDLSCDQVPGKWLPSSLRTMHSMHGFCGEKALSPCSAKSFFWNFAGFRRSKHWRADCDMNSPQPALGPSLLWHLGSYRFWLWCQPRFSEHTGVVDEFLLMSPCLQLDFEFGWNPHVMWRFFCLPNSAWQHPLVAPIDWTLTPKVGPVEASSNWSLKLPVISTINNH